MSNINTFLVSQYGAVIPPASMLLNMNGFLQVQDNGNNTTFVKYSPNLGEDNFTPIVINESIASVNAKLDVKGIGGALRLLVIKDNGRTVNTVYTLDSTYIVNVKQDVNPTNSVIVYQTSNKEQPNVYLVQANFTAILSAIIAPVFPQFSNTFERTITTDPQTITLPTPAPGVPYKVEYSLVNLGGNGVNSISIIDESSFDISVVTTPTQATFTITYP